MKSRSHLLGSLAAGILFGLGLAVSGMTDPARVVGFLDVFGEWDPTLGFVMAGALAVTTIAFRAALGRLAPVLGDRFHVPSRHEVDGSLLAGAAIFGAGWGLSGFCPGPAIASLAYGLLPAAVFVAAMVAGMAAFELWRVPRGTRRTAREGLEPLPVADG